MSEAQEVVKAVLRSQDEMLVLVAVGILLVGIWFGYVLRRWSWIPRKRQRAFFNDAPVPMAPPRDSRRGEKVVICGYEWTRMN